MTDIRILLVAAMLASGFTQTPAAPQVPVRKLSADREVLRADVAITTLAGVELDKLTAAKVIEHDSEVGRSEHVTVIVMALGCLRDAEGLCDASADVVVYRPDDTVHSQMNIISLATGRATTTLKLSADDVTGVYKVVANVRDLAAKRLARTERLFGVK
jgi:hypothetical protein